MGKGIGMKKHGQGGTPPKSPRTRLLMKLDAERNEKKAPPPLPDQSVRELFDGERTRRKGKAV